MTLTVVIPTYNRGLKLGATLDAVLACDTAVLDAVEVIVVDDGSPTPAEPLVASYKAAPPFTLRCVRQPNAGPAKARNTGFREAHGEVVLFMDDDILPTSPVLRQHAQAHITRPRAVICGSCLLIDTDPPSNLTRFMNTLSANAHPTADGVGTRFDLCPLVSSGQVSVERAMFDPATGVYDETLAVPAAEEYELTSRLQRKGIQCLHAPWITAWHDHPVTIAGMCRQQYKHAVGCAEVALKRPESLDLPDLKRVIEANRPGGGKANGLFKRLAKRITASQLCRQALARLASWSEKFAPQVITDRLYYAAIAAHFTAGIRDGLLKYNTGVSR
jgi:cellulose synthase/poly-beta-1,6-N-acetylglucosamine synthase-like glycosyltransferase